MRPDPGRQFHASRGGTAQRRWKRRRRHGIAIRLPRHARDGATAVSQRRRSVVRARRSDARRWYLTAVGAGRWHAACGGGRTAGRRSEEHTSELQSLMRISYAVFCLKKKKK